MLDDASPFGIDMPNAYLDLLRENNESLELLDAEKLASELAEIANSTQYVTQEMYMPGSGGVLTAALLARYGFRPKTTRINVKRNYIVNPGEKRPTIKYEIESPMDKKECCVIVDDIIASGGTINALINYSGVTKADVYTLLLSGKTRGEFRCKDGSTVKGVETLRTAQVVDWEKGMPAILSFRFLLEKARTSKNYVEYISKYTGGDMQQIVDIISKVDTGPFELLFSRPDDFFRRFGGV